MFADLFKENVSLVPEKHSAHAHSWVVEFCNVGLLHVWECLDPALGFFFFTDLLLEKFNHLDSVCHDVFLHSSLLLSELLGKRLWICVSFVTDNHISKVI